MESSSLAFVLLVGPQASGKSTIARALAAELRREGERVALVELDQIAEMARPTLPSWDTASRIFAMVAGEWARDDLTCVIAEGISSQDEVSILLEQVPEAAAMITVAMTTPLEAALPRAQADPSRSTSPSRDRYWLAERYQEWSLEKDRIGADVLLDASAMPLDQSVRKLIADIRSARASHG
ncbi:AAA family ATPase [Microlunatus soli]|uniref:AAA domain-containing protein n=1 Tax=Microlunatus soli TaxID=630515 RepID=A0A1H1RGM3_9ACTN|nr:AAA family ATPase [Microlunatus soli]SDS34947.1 AAA domain-containing protein [Microlunatus soli]